MELSGDRMCAAMRGGQSVRSRGTFRRSVYRLFLALTRLVIDPLVAGQPPNIGVG
jgi:hypothetical protein